MKERDLQTARPRRVCGAQEDEVEDGTDDLEKLSSLLEVDEEDFQQQCGWLKYGGPCSATDPS